MATDPRPSDPSAPTATDAARQAADSAKSEASHLASEASQQARSLIDQQKDLAADRLDDVAKALRQTADQLDQQAPGMFANYARRAVSGLDGCASALRNKNVDALIADAENFARREPALFVAGSVAVGFALARFLKSSASRSHRRATSEGMASESAYSAPEVT